MLDTKSPLDTPIWDPALAASAGAGFAGVLGAIVVAITFQIVLSRATGDPVGPEQIQSSAVAPFGTLLLLTAAYLYVVLSGTASKVTVAAVACGADVHAASCVPGYTYILTSAVMFAIGGSYLGSGAMVVAFTLLSVMTEHPKGDEPTVRDAMLLLYISGTGISLLALLWGYRDAAWVIENRSMHIWEFILFRGAWAWMLIGLALGLFLAAVHIIMSVVGYSGWRRKALVPIITSFVISPVIWFLVVQGTPPGSRPYGASVIPQFMAGWSCALATFFTVWLPQFRERRRKFFNTVMS